MSINKLKTLKDLEKTEMSFFTNKTGNMLRQEAIRWIKELETRMSILEEKYHYSEKSLLDTIRWITYFFNIKEKDLK